MGKVKSAIITSLLVIAIVVAAFFGVASFNVSSTQRLNSVASSIHLGGEFSGYAYTTLYPEGVISAQDYKFLEEDEAQDYTAVGGVYVSNDKNVDDLKADVQNDAAIINDRFAQKGLSSFTVAVEDGLAIKVSIPTNYTYAAYKGDGNSRSADYSVALATISALTADGRFTFRTTDKSVSVTDDEGTSTTLYAREDEYTSTAQVSSSDTYSLVKKSEDISSYVKSVSNFTFGTTSVISFDLTESGRARMRDITTYIASTSSQTLYVFLGDTQMLQISCTSTIDSDTLQFTSSDANSASNSAIALNSAINGNELALTYSDTARAFSTVASAGENAALFAAIACLLLVVAVIVIAVVKYKKLGIVFGLNALVFALVMLYAFLILSVQVTTAVLLTAAAGLALFTFSNFYVFEETRTQCKTGKVIQSAVKAAYKRTAFALLDAHVVVLALAIFLTFVGAGSVASCGLALIIATIASYALYWFTRFMWYVLSSNTKDRFAFCGFKREVYGDE